MPLSGSPLRQMRRVALSLENWREAPPRILLKRADSVRFAHAVATLANDLVTAMEAMGEPPPWTRGRVSADHPGLRLPGFWDRVEAMVALENHDLSADIAEQLVRETIHRMAAQGLPVDTVALPDTPVSTGPADEQELCALVHAVFLRARRVGAVAALVADSYARGCADAHSDVDIRLLATQHPDARSRREALAPLAERGLVRQYGEDDNVQADQFVIHRRRVDIRFHTVASIEMALYEPVASNTRLEALELLETHRTFADPARVWAPLAGEGELRKQRARELARESFRALRLWDADIDRVAGPVTETTARTLGPGLEYLVRTWAGINGRIHAFPKWVQSEVCTLPVGPEGGEALLNAPVLGPWTSLTVHDRREEWKRLVAAFSKLDGWE